jgi:hypothetical protein
MRPRIALHNLLREAALRDNRRDLLAMSGLQ